MGLEFNFVKFFFIVLTMNFYIKVKFFKEKKQKQNLDTHLFDQNF
jgi:hypothetical protein